MRIQRKILFVFIGVSICLVASISQASKLQSINSAVLNSSNQQPSDEFANAVAVDGNTVVVGAIGAQVNGSPTGAAYVYVKPSTGWVNATQTATLTASDAAYHFGASVAISGDTIVVGAPYTSVNGDPQEGAIYVYVKPAGGWTNMTETAKLTGYHIDGVGEDHVGTEVAIDGDTIIATVPNVIPDYHALGLGEVFVYQKPLGGWTNMLETAVLYSLGGYGFASSASISGNSVVVGADGCCSNGELTTGAAFVYVEPAGGWATTPDFNAQLSGQGVDAYDQFGYAVAISGSNVVVGAPQIFGVNIGSAYIFEEPSGGWTNMTQNAILFASETLEGDFGETLAMNGGTILAGAPFTDIVHGQQGVAYVFLEPTGGWRTTDHYKVMLSAPGGNGFYFGQSLSVSGNTAVVGVAGTYDTNGEAIVYWVNP